MPCSTHVWVHAVGRGRMARRAKPNQLTKDFSGSLLPRYPHCVGCQALASSTLSGQISERNLVKASCRTDDLCASHGLTKLTKHPCLSTKGPFELF